LFVDYSSESDVFRVYPLPKLFYELRNACASNRPGAVGFPAFILAERELEKDVFNYTTGISCEVGIFKYLCSVADSYQLFDTKLLNHVGI
jgi:hypothetical protein